MLFSLPILMYHSISRYKHKLCVPPELFEEHCKALRQAGWRGIRLEEAEHYALHKKTLPRKSCLLTFDDGYLDSYVHAEPILRHYGHHGVLFPVAECLEADGDPLRPNRAQIREDEQLAASLPDLDGDAKILRAGRQVRRIVFCNWSEIRWMHQHGNMAAAPHSLRHDRVVSGPECSRLLRPLQAAGYFAVAPYTVPFGFPQFDLGHALAERGYTLNPELFDLVRKLVPQNRKKAAEFLKNPENQKNVLAAIRALPSLGTLETEDAYRARIFQEFRACRDLFTQQLGTPPVSFCWPWGAYSEAALEEGQKAGFRVFFTTERGPNLPGHPLRLSRLRIRADSSPEELLGKVRYASVAPYEAARVIVGRALRYWREEKCFLKWIKSKSASGGQRG